MKVFPITKKNEFKQTVAILDSIELRILIAEAIAKKLNIDLEDKRIVSTTPIRKF